MRKFKRWLEGGTVALISCALVCVSTATLVLPSMAKAEGELCWSDRDCSSQEYCDKPAFRCAREETSLTCSHIVQGLSGGASVFAISAALFGVAPVPGSRLPAAISLILSATFAFGAWYVSVLCDD